MFKRNQRVKYAVQWTNLDTGQPHKITVFTVITSVTKRGIFCKYTNRKFLPDGSPTALWDSNLEQLTEEELVEMGNCVLMKK